MSAINDFRDGWGWGGGGGVVDGQPTSIKVSLKCHRWHFLLQAGNWRFRIA